MDAFHNKTFKLVLCLILFFTAAIFQPKLVSGQTLAITTQDPAPDTVNFPIDGTITITFSENMRTSTLNSNNIYLRKTGYLRNISGEIALSSSGRTLRFIPTSPLEYDTSYTFYVNGARDSLGRRIHNTNWRFYTEEKGHPVIVDKMPTPNTSSQPLDQKVVITFSEPLNATTVKKENVYLKNAETGTLVDSFIHYNNRNNSITLTPIKPLSYDTMYTVHATDRLHDREGYFLEPTSWQFSTIATEASRIINKYPSENQQNINVDSDIIIDFSKDLHQQTINTDNITLMDEHLNISVPITLNYINQKNRIVIKPQGGLKYSRTYSVNIKDSIIPLNWSFKTKPEPIQKQGTSLYPLVVINDQLVHFPDVQPYVKNNRAFIPFRGLFEALGPNSEISFDASNPEKVRVWGRHAGNQIELYIGEKVAYKNNAPVSLEVAPEIFQNRTMIPLRFAAESLGKKVHWNQDSNIIFIK